MSTDEAVNDAVDAVEDVDEDVTKSQRDFARTYLVVLFSLVAVVVTVGGTASVYFGYVTPALVLSGTVSVGWVVELIVGGIAVMFLLFTFAMILIALPVSILQGIIRLAGAIGEVGR